MERKKETTINIIAEKVLKYISVQIDFDRGVCQISHKFETILKRVETYQNYLLKFFIIITS